METSFRRVLGLYFLVASLQYLPVALFMFGVQNPAGPKWILPAIPFAQGVVTALAGLFLFRSRSKSTEVAGTVTIPSIESILQLLGVFFAVSGLVASVRPLVDHLFFNEVWSISLGGSFAAAGASVLAGGFLLARPHTLAKLIEPYSAA
jgi:hypothetical protein